MIEIINEIQQKYQIEKDIFEEIRYILRPFEENLPLKIKRLFNIATLDNYTIFIASRHFETVDDHINLVMTSKRFKLNMTKFHYNPIQLTQTTREYFTHLQTFYLYSSKDNLFENDSRIIAIQSCKNDKYNLYLDEMKQLENWTHLKCGDVLFDSNKDNWSINTSVFNEIIIGKSKLTFLIEDQDDEVFGCYLNTEIVDNYHEMTPTDSKSFLFNLHSNNNRLKKPMKFNVIDEELAQYCLHMNSTIYLIVLGDICLYKYNWKNHSYCDIEDDYCYNYQGINEALCGKTGKNDPFNPKRIIVIQMI